MVFPKAETLYLRKFIVLVDNYEDVSNVGLLAFFSPTAR